MDMRGKHNNHAAGSNHYLYKHGVSKRDKNGLQKPIYSTWVRMRQRCNNPRNPDYRYYGGRGIKHCKRWDNFTNFYEDMGKSYFIHKQKNSSTTLERINVNGNYSLDNCKWATRKEQARNRNCTPKATFRGITKPLSQWSEELPIRITFPNLLHRLARGWTIERAFTQPLGTRIDKI